VPFRLIWPDKRGGFYKSIQHHLKDLLLKDGVYERREPIETYSLAEDGYLGPLEGTNENSNLLLRQYFPSGTDLSAYSQAQLDLVALRLNQRPRKTLGFETPASKLQPSVALTG
jgi:hypothetical protein